jgi:N-methylhydantoinase A/oxoprolinase/acetone carboxylase beta subunit
MRTVAAARAQAVRDTGSGDGAERPVYDRGVLHAGAALGGPAIIAEAETSTLVCPGWRAQITTLGYIELSRETA